MSKILNGGIVIQLGQYTLETINGYSPSWTDEETEAFENWDFSTVTVYKGQRFSASVTANNLSADDKAALITALSPRIIDAEFPDFSGKVKISGVSAVLTQGNFYGERYTVTFSAAAVDLTPIGGGL